MYQDATKKTNFYQCMNYIKKLPSVMATAYAMSATTRSQCKRTPLLYHYNMLQKNKTFTKHAKYR